MNHTKLNVIGLSKVWLGFSAILMLVSIVSVAVFGLNLGIDFTGGSLIEVQSDNRPASLEVTSKLSEFGFSTLVQESDDDKLIIRLGQINTDEHEQILGILNENYGQMEELQFEFVGPVIGEELKKKSAGAIVLLLALIVLYVAWTFRKVSKPIASWKYGLLTIIAALHDIILPIGIFAVLGKLYGYQVDTAFVAALLTILGYSINDTIVVFDRTRENLISNRHSDASFGDIVNKSVQQSFARSINTSLTTLLVLLAIFFFGGETTKPFVLALIVGIVSGAYSSIFVASPLLVIWNKMTK
ncbi:protein translocase subunit SecF [Candidatus Uhrbacteria bacterium CG_4_9_14_3_um_filter_41_35]|uniref:Protein-export membrane protein SecF n=1 Tax=Candidatus Uhrbacteria bacterium CG_4_9_14_3_um_filter_41_35 TaxID=1975034 RepID=A0A2M7XDU9_9BACT|nr:MAG: protein translocase subunit SecF [Candidatus Uhrbacteria bacterium CG11_big_fil_rev_8_21_14_0_20_41_9]PJA46012.1 MAG: protein translocase subunit SecF [Candidatus Uhrbacteria bacterium CG_4_9_14_3_um_filter_41_35]